MNKETNLEKARRLLHAHALIQGAELTDSSYLFKMLDLAATPDKSHHITPEVIQELAVDKYPIMDRSFFPFTNSADYAKYRRSQYDSRTAFTNGANQIIKLMQHPNS